MLQWLVACGAGWDGAGLINEGSEAYHGPIVKWPEA